MPCPPSWEEQMILRADYQAERLEKEYPALYERYLTLNELLRELKVVLPLKTFEARPAIFYPKITENDWPTYEDGQALSEYETEVISYFAELERWLCEASTALVLAWDKLEMPISKDFEAAVMQQIALHKVHREEDRQETLGHLRQMIRSIEMYIATYDERRQKEELERKAQFLSQIAPLEALTIEELIRDRSLTDIKY